MRRKMNKIQDFLTAQQRNKTWLSEQLEQNGVRITRQTLTKYCSNEQQPRLDDLAAIAEVLGVSVRSLIGDGSEIED